MPSGFGGGAWATWDGLPVSQEPPHGCSVVVFRWADDGLRLLLLHRRHNGADYEGDWAWTSPSGARLPGELVDECARRELAEEAGLALPMRPTACGTVEWRVYVAEAPMDAAIALDMEHDRFEWLPPTEALPRISPDLVRRSLACAVTLLEQDRERTA
jgi:8-oxo-dGTP pyrophosphatase MutT (NUDIX family)